MPDRGGDHAGGVLEREGREGEVDWVCLCRMVQ
jgi:hypothetical protein